ncbi:MAG: PrgI family protein [Candidatus Buchananbacteria bacterium]
MQQFVVPQFIDVEDKVLGPVTVRQFIICLVGGGMIFVAYKLADFTLFIVEGLAIAFVTLIIAFVKINGRPIHYFILNIIQTLMRERLRVWVKIFSKAEIRSRGKEPITKLPVAIIRKNKVRASRLAEMSLIVDTGGVYEGEKEPPASKDQIV